MRDFEYDIDKYITYRKKQRERAKEQEFGDNIEIDDIVEDVKRAKDLCNNIKKECKLSENAKRCVHDIERRVA